jgi:hypothetical protein
MYGLLYECKFLTIEETNKKKRKKKKNNICHSGSSQVYIPCLFYISPERISNTRYLFCVLHHWASFTRECHGTATLQTQTTSTYDVIGHR